MKKLASLLPLLVALGLAFAQPQVPALPDDERFDQPVELQTETDGESLRAMVSALARAVGLTPVIEGVPNTNVIYDIGDPKPFRQVWELVLTLNDLDYLLLENDVVVVGPSDAVSKLRRADDPLTAITDTSADQRFYRIAGHPENLAEIVRKIVPGVTVEVLPGVRTLLVTGSEEQHERVEAALAEFDSDATAATEPATPDALLLRTYPLSNGKAEEVAQVLAAVLQDEVTTSTDDADDSEASQAKRADNRFRVTAEARTNSLLVAAPAHLQALVAELIPTLDAPQQQVNVQVRIQEVSTRTAADLGINLSAGVGKFAANILDTGLKFVFNSQNAVSGLNIGAVLDTLETQGLSRRVDDTNVTVLNNMPATVQAGGTIYITIPGAEENIERTIPYGVQIDVTPRIGNDGRINLDVEARVEDVVSETRDPSFLELSTRAVNSTITLEPGQTVLLSGLMQNQFIQTRNQVPVLGSIPVIGNLFGSTVTEENETELLVIVTASLVE